MNLKNKDKYNKNKERNEQRKKLLKEKQNNNKEHLDPLLDHSNLTKSIEKSIIETKINEPLNNDVELIQTTYLDNNISVKNVSTQTDIKKKIKSKAFKETNTEMEPIQNEMKEIEFKNPIFEKNVIDPTNNKIVKSIYVHSWTKLARDHWFMIWQYYRDRKRTSIQEVYDKYKDTQLRIIYKGDPNMYYVGEKKEKPEPKIRNKLQKNISES
jgi:hypothetical protein